MTPAACSTAPGSLVHRFIVAGERSRLENDASAESRRALREMISSRPALEAHAGEDRGGS